MRVYVAVSTTIWCAAVAASGVRGALSGSEAAFVTVPMLAIGAVLGYRLLRLGVTADQGCLLVRNNWSTRTVARADIEGFRTGAMTAGGPPGSQAVQVLLRDQTVLPLDVTVAALPLPRSRTRLQGQLEQLRAWHDAG